MLKLQGFIPAVLCRKTNDKDSLSTFVDIFYWSSKHDRFLPFVRRKSTYSCSVHFLYFLIYVLNFSMLLHIFFVKGDYSQFNILSDSADQKLLSGLQLYSTPALVNLSQFCRFAKRYLYFMCFFISGYKNRCL